MQLLPLSVSYIAETTPNYNKDVEGFVHVMLDSKVNSGGEEIIEDDDGERVDNDCYSITEALDGEYFEYINYPKTVSVVHNGTQMIYLFTTC